MKTKKTRRITRSSWPRSLVPSIECRPRDLVIRIADWTRDRDEPAFDVETYIGGVYDWYESKVFPAGNATPKQTKAQARSEAIAYAQAKVAKWTGKRIPDPEKPNTEPS